MEKSLLEVYALAVCFVTVICFAVALGVGAYDIIEIKDPEFTLYSWQNERHQSNEAFIKTEVSSVTNRANKKKESEEEITKRRLASYQQALRTEQRSAMQSLTMALNIMLIDAICFFIHWRIAKRSRLSANVGTG